jgi:hypothetical protein
MMRSPDASAAVAGALADANPHVRTMAVQAASELEGTERCSHLESAVRDWSTWVRRAALRSLGTSGCPSAEGILLEAAVHGAGGRTALDLRQERIAALEGLAALHSPSAGEELLRFTDPEPALTPAVWKAIAASGGDRCCSAMAEAIGRRDPAALQALQFLHTGVTGEACTELLDSALTGLHHLGGPGARAALTALAGMDAPASGALRQAAAAWLASPPAGDMDLVAEVVDRRAVDCGADAFRRFFEKSLPAGQIPDDVVARLASVLPRQGGARPGTLRRLLRHPGGSVRLSAARSVVQVLVESDALRPRN